jgi:hypothetical protein
MPPPAPPIVVDTPTWSFLVPRREDRPAAVTLPDATVAVKDRARDQPRRCSEPISRADQPSRSAETVEERADDRDVRGLVAAPQVVTGVRQHRELDTR